MAIDEDESSQAKTTDIIVQAYQKTVVEKPIELSKSQKKIDQISDRVFNAHANVDTFWATNQAILQKAAVTIASLDIDNKTIESAINGFAETTKVVMKGLDALGQVHPFIGVAVVAFKLVVTLDLTRRENNKKVLAIRVQMQNMMCELFQLRHMKDPDDTGPDGMTLKDRFQGLMEKIAHDITECGSACDAYMKKSFLAKTIKSRIYEERLGGYGTRFVNCKAEIEHALAIHTALGVDAANAKLDKQDETLRSIDDKLSMMMLFRKLDTPREREVAKFIEENGGAKACIENQEVLTKLVGKTGEPISSVTGDTRRGDGISSAQKVLMKEYYEDVDEMLRKNMVLFAGKLDIQSKQLSESIRREGDHIISALSSGSHDRIKDSDLQKMWKEMGWKGSVKARHFVLALRDYFTDRFDPGSAPSVSSNGTSGDPLALTGVPQDSLADDHWALPYISVTNLQPILEAFDDDGTGFININEANTFALERPQGWSLIRWIAYWAAGWRLSVSSYRNKIYLLLQELHRLLSDILPENKKFADECMNAWGFCRVELLLRSTDSSYDDGNPGALNDITDEYAKSEEARIGANLESVSYNLDSSSTVLLVVGPSRIERHIYPLIYLLLRRYMDTMKIACRHILNREELPAMNDTLLSAFEALDDRVEHLEAVYKQMHLDVEAQFNNWAFGMLSQAHGDISDNYFKGPHSVMSWNDESTEVDEERSDEVSSEDLSLKILKYDVVDTYTFERAIQDFTPTSLGQDAPERRVAGTWAGHCYTTTEEDVSISVQGLLELKLNPILSGKFPRKLEGIAEGYLGVASISGTYSLTETNAYSLEFSMTYKSGRVFHCAVNVADELDQDMVGTWEDGGQEEEEEEEEEEEIESDSDSDSDSVISSEAMEDDASVISTVLEDDRMSSGGALIFSRVRAETIRFKPPPEAFKTNQAKALWSFACSSVLNDVRCRVWSWQHTKEEFESCRDFMNLTLRRLIDTGYYTPREPLTVEELARLRYHRFRIHPTSARLFQSLAEDKLARMPDQLGCACDGCHRKILQPRLACITCSPKGFQYSYDTCITCSNRYNSAHLASHSIIRASSFMHDCVSGQYFTDARRLSRRLKASFRAIEDSEEDESTVVPTEVMQRSVQAGSNSPMLCACCGKAITLPFWVCLICQDPTYVCQTCDEEGLAATETGPSPSHELSHVALKIKTSDEEVDVEGDEFSRIQERMDTMEENFGARLDALETRVESGFTTLEGLLRQILLQISSNH
ncbi:hypothetical protein B0H34DRAFT_733496 [Crassisporium funariophilum]|nr:hypothetical protein B0H34DRAFT_733496 [Crassisporium funariophilum]